MRTASALSEPAATICEASAIGVLKECPVGLRESAYEKREPACPLEPGVVFIVRQVNPAPTGAAMSRKFRLQPPDGQADPSGDVAETRCETPALQALARPPGRIRWPSIERTTP